MKVQLLVKNLNLGILIHKENQISKRESNFEFLQGFKLYNDSKISKF